MWCPGIAKTYSLLMALLHCNDNGGRREQVDRESSSMHMQFLSSLHVDGPSRWDSHILLFKLPVLAVEDSELNIII